MGERSELWAAIRDSPFFVGIYIPEVYWLAAHVEAECTGIFDDVQPPAAPGTNEIRVDHSVHERIFGILLAGARIRALVRTRKRKRASKRQREILKLRTRDLRELLAGIDLDPVLDADARHSIEHFDEHLDDTALAAAMGSIPRPTLFAVDMVVSTRAALQQVKVKGETPNPYLIRAYIADERVFANCGRELKLEPLRDCCGEIRARLEPLVHAPDGRGSPLLAVTDETFAGGP